MRKVFLIPNLVTAFALACGLFVVFKMATAVDVNFHLIYVLSILLIVGAIADVLDGAIARFIHAESEFGVQFDSLSDAVTFGVAPAVLVITTIKAAPGTTLSFFMIAAALLFSVCGVLRLVRFNVKNSQAKESAALMHEHKKNFTGLPIPAAALAAVSANLLLASDELPALQPVTRAAILGAVLAVLGYFMISRWKFPSVKTLHIRVRSFNLVFITVLIALGLLYGVLNYFAILFAVVTWGYILVAWTLSIVRLLAGKRSKTLVDFEPEPEDELD